ncbi:glycosyltransferase involved in cell wall biosynthesis [Actinomycetospora succinea]|uniref:Glycosyltransferase involved in cell wall biosynthesis n=1 Tax=Actinomycetospora succinea TaxID=663603 RepID=A0A4R6UT07_9PSEU|nr:glycosyltransferase family 4 protein [Actinomycetospora succinea]TDQ48959.1 glycosyltransferase involved in cell wall biosynthesis [Actinomycetospora succinea]
MTGVVPEIVPPVAAVAPPPATGAGTTPAPAQTGGHATLLSASAGLVGLLSYACTLVMAHLLAPAEYTAFAGAAALVGTAGVASAALVPLPLAHVVRAHPAGSAARRDALTFATAVSVLVGLAAGVVLGAVVAGFAAAATALAAGLSAWALFAIAPVWGRLQGESRFARYALLTVAEVAVRLGVSVGAVLLGAGAAGAVGAFAAGAVVVLLAAGRSRGARAGGARDALAASHAANDALAPHDTGLARLRRILGDRARWAETGGVAAVQLVLSTLAAADVVVVANVAESRVGVVAAAGYQAVATLAKAPVYVAVGTALVSFPVLRALPRRGAEEARDRALREALTTFVRLAVPAAAVVATVPPVIVGLVLPAAYTPSLALLPPLALAGLGLGATTVLATLLLAVGARRSLAVALVLATVALAAGIAAGLADGAPGLATGTAAGALGGALLLTVLGVRHHPRTGRAGAGLVAWVVRGLLWAAVAVGLLGVTRPLLPLWLLAVVVLGVGVVGLPVITGRLRAAVDPKGELRPAPGGMHVLHLAFEDPKMPGSGGGAKRTAEIDRRLAAAGHHVTAVTQTFPGARDRTEFFGDGVLRWVHVGVGRGGNRLTRLLGYVAGLPFVVRGVEADVVIEDFFAPISSLSVPRFSPAPTVGIVQWLNAREKSRQYKLPLHWIERFGVRSHRRLIGMSQGVADALLATNPRAEVAVIGNGVDPQAFRERRRGPGTDVVFVGRLEIAQKGLDLLVDAWARVAGRIGGRLVLAGTGPDEAALRERAERHGVGDSVVFAGWVSGEDKYDLVANARLAVVPSRFETFGIVAAEALACGTAVVAYDIPCLREVVRSEAGVLVPYLGDHAADVTALATALRAVACCEGLREAAAERGPALAAVHDWDALARTQECVLRAAAGLPPAPVVDEIPDPEEGPVTTRFPRPDLVPRPAEEPT